MTLLPVGQRPKCFACSKELRPVFKWNPMPYTLLGGGEENEKLRQAWKTLNPKQFTGKYGGYGDSRFCGLNCGYRYALYVTKATVR